MARHAIILIILLSIRMGISDELVCEFLQLNVLDIVKGDEVYSCKGRVNLGDNDGDTTVSGIHKLSKSNENVKGLQITEDDMSYFIKNIDKTFPNLEQINLSSNKITKLTNEDLLPHKNLKYFMINNNNISSLNSNIFENLPKLEEFYFIDNGLLHVQHDITLPTNVSFYFKNNTCINENATDTEAVQRLQYSFIVNCPPTISQIEDTLQKRKNLFTYLRTRNIILKERLAQLEEQNQKRLEALSDI